MFIEEEVEKCVILIAVIIDFLVYSTPLNQTSNFGNGNINAQYVIGLDFVSNDLIFERVTRSSYFQKNETQKKSNTE